MTVSNPEGLYEVHVTATRDYVLAASSPEEAADIALALLSKELNTDWNPSGVDFKIKKVTENQPSC